METEDLIKLPASSNSEHESEHNDTYESGSEAIKSDSLPISSEVTEEINEEAPGVMSDGLHDNMETSMTTNFEKDPDPNTPAPQIGFEMTDSVAEVEKTASISFVHTENGSLSVQSELSLRNRSKNETLSGKREVDARSLSGVKRPRMTVDEQQPSVHVIYSSLPRESKRKLEKLLEQWSQWHSERCSSSDDSKIELESGEKTYFPALRVGLDKPSAVTFWVDDQTKIQSSKEFVSLDSASVPLYDRGYSLALTSADGSSGLDGGVEKLDTSRCFNCGSYSHALKDCPKPRDNVAVNNARKEHKLKRNQHANARNSTRYYQSSRGGKYDGLTPGVLDAETRRVLGLGELDPPPWLNRMREIGYPPGYLVADIEDQPSGITIFGDEANMDESEEGEILGASYTTPSRKMTVEFPGINASIPENADERLWAPNADERLRAPNADERVRAPPSSSSFNTSRYNSHRRYDHSYESPGSGHYSERRRSRDWEDDGPPGCDPGTSPSLSNRYYRYGDVESNHYSLSPRASPPAPWSSSYGRSFSDRSRRSPRSHDGYPEYGHYGTFPYSSPR